MRRARRGIYVETVIDAPFERVWALSQGPAQHARWDLRFGRIEPQASEEGVRRFTYSTFGVSGTGVHVGDRWRETGGATSSVRFASPHVLSPIAECAGYWRYEPEKGALRFLTGYDYRARYRRIDVLFRPLMGWATAWPFDRLRLWAERDQAPARSLAFALGNVAARPGDAGEGMTSIFAQVLGMDFGRLHPALQSRFGLKPGELCVGRGEMREVWRGPRLHGAVLAARHTAQHPVSRDRPPCPLHHREPRVRRRSRARDGLLRAHLRIRRRPSAAFRCHDDPRAGCRRGRLPRDASAPRRRAGRARGRRRPRHSQHHLRERYDDAAQEYAIDVRVEHPRFGPVFGYDGRFVCEFAERPASPVVMPYSERPAPVGWAG